MRKLTLPTLVAVTAVSLASVAAGVAPANAAPATAALATRTHVVKQFTMSYGPAEDYGKANRFGPDGPDACKWSLGAGATPGNPTNVTFRAVVDCGSAIPTATANAVVTAHLYSRIDSFFADGPKVQNVAAGVATSQATARDTRPDTLYIEGDSNVTLWPTTGGKINIWYDPPAGCSGSGTPVAICKLVSPDETI